jgi:uncharacterized integral membrane protein
MKSVLRLSYYAVLILAALYFAEANRGPVKVSLDPFPGGESGPSFEAPLFLVVLASVALGVILGASSSWMRHRSVRRAARLARVEAAKAQSELERLRQQALASLPSAPARK